MVENNIVCIVRYGEIALKGKNRHIFEKKLVSNIRQCLIYHGLPFMGVHRIRGRILTYTSNYLTNKGGIQGGRYFNLTYTDKRLTNKGTKKYIVNSLPTYTVNYLTNKDCIQQCGNINLTYTDKQLTNKGEKIQLNPTYTDNSLTNKGNKPTTTDLLLTYKERFLVLKTVFGVASISFAIETSPFLDAIKNAVNLLLHGKRFSTFRITADRIDKTVNKPSREYENEVGDYVRTAYAKTVSLKGYELNICIELMDRKAYVFLEKIEGIGGLPLGVGSHAFALIDSTTHLTYKKSLLSALLAMKRGTDLIFLCLKTDSVADSVVDSVVDSVADSVVDSVADSVADSLGKSFVDAYYHKNPEIIKINSIKEIDGLGKQYRINSLFLPQTMKEFKKVCSLVEFRPLVSYTDEEINERIGQLLP